jgi:hypothetical protein
MKVTIARAEFAGLSCARALSRPGLPCGVALLEAQDPCERRERLRARLPEMRCGPPGWPTRALKVTIRFTDPPEIRLA